MHRSRPERPALLLLALQLLITPGMGARAAAEPRTGAARAPTLLAQADAPTPSATSSTAGGSSTAPADVPGPTDPSRPPPGTILLVLPAVTGRGGEWVAPWTNPSESARFAKLEEDLSTSFRSLGYGVMTAREAVAIASAAAALRDAPRPITPEAAASAARAAHATLALLLRAEALRRTEPKQVFTDALVSAEVYRAADAVRLAWGSAKVSGAGPTETDADVTALSHAAAPLLAGLAGPLLAAVRRPVIAPHPVAVFIEGDLDYRQYRRLIGLLQHEIPEIRELQERRFSHGRQTLRAVCACQPWDISQRLDGRTTGGFVFDVRSELEGVRVRARPVGAGGISP